MKSLMRALGILCVVNMLALLLLAGWLLGTDRLTPQRLLAIRAMLSTTAAQERARLDAEQAEQKRLEAEQVRREREQNPDPPADALVQRQA
ncbi:MAG: hypothetical protein KJZ68_12730, partial [Phycisphaerales bacterium]|nr:hypothetical protein [Phycisphaerales bacterium]